MRAVLLCSGLATRMGGKVKPLIKVGGREVLYRTITLLKKYGVQEFIVVVNRRNRQPIEEFLKSMGVKYRIIVNEHPERGNGYSLYLAKDAVKGRFVLVMGDHIFGEDFVRDAIVGEGVVCDRTPGYVRVDEATKVLTENGRVKEIGKNLRDYCCVDTGFFVLDESVFKVAEEALMEKDAVELSEVVRRAGLKVHNVDGRFWMDIDTMEDVERAERALFSLAVKQGEDGFVSRTINRKISTRISRAIVNRIEPIHATILSFIAGVLSALSLFVSIPLAGVLYQISSILDGVDGEIARVAMKTSKTGGWIDSILDRVVDFLFLALLAFLTMQTRSEFLIAMLAIFGSFMVSYVSEKYKAEFGESVYRRVRVWIPGKRDERIFLVMLFCLMYPAVDMLFLFALLALLTIGRVVEVAVRAYMTLNKDKKNGEC